MRRRPGSPQIRMAETGPSGLAFYPQAGASFWRIPFALFQEFLVPPFNHLHPAIVHFPIALLATAPLLFLLGALWPAQRRGIHASALLLLLLGLLGGLAALATGDAAEKLAHRTPELRAALNHHEFLAESTVSIFGVLAASWLLYLGGTALLPPGPSPGLGQASVSPLAADQRQWCRHPRSHGP